jgi:hypothetical protein
MALTTPSASPAVSVREIDLTGVAPNVQSTTGAIVGKFIWGPADQRVLVSNENELVSKFGTPTNETAVDFLSAAYFLKYSSALYVVRASGDALNATNGTPESIQNESVWDTKTPASGTFFAKYPGALGNSIKVDIADASGFAGWVYEGQFDEAPASDEVHVVVSDTNGGILGDAGILEVFSFVSTTPGAKTDHGANNYISDVLNNQSAFIWASDFELLIESDASTMSVQLSGGTDDNAGTQDYGLFADVDTVTVDFLIASESANLNGLIAIAKSRKDCVVVASPSKDAVFAVDPVLSTSTWVSDKTKSTYVVVDNNFLKVYDKYNDKYAFIPAASSTAGIMAASDAATAPWFSPAGDRRGAYLGITDVAYNPSKSQRDELYKMGINPVANIPGSGVVLYGDKTFVSRPSAFDRINVRRLFLVLERSISIAGKNVMFEFNDEFTRAEFVNIVEPLLREVQGRRGITDFRVVCDETNNTAAVIDRNEFVASIFIKPARSINYVTLNFVAVRTGVEFEEIVGSV